MYYGLTKAFLGATWFDVGFSISDLTVFYRAEDKSLRDVPPPIPDLRRPLLGNVQFGSYLRRFCLRFEEPMPHVAIWTLYPRHYWDQEKLDSVVATFFASMRNIQYFELFVHSAEIYDVLAERGFLATLRWLLVTQRHVLREVFIRGGPCRDFVHELHACLYSLDTRVRARGIAWNENPCNIACEGLDRSKETKPPHVEEIIGGSKDA